MAPCRTSAPADEMKMWNISVAPMPSIISMPVASRQRVRVASGRPSPALTHRRSEGMPTALANGAICR
jgi:hypothetical protein